MPEYVITFTRSARKELEALPSQLVKRIYSRIEGLGSTLVPRAAES
jgi:mRNA-degrading endonuclease RelE of RelBE toxin-antitoxin system